MFEIWNPSKFGVSPLQSICFGSHFGITSVMYWWLRPTNSIGLIGHLRLRSNSIFRLHLCLTRYEFKITFLHKVKCKNEKESRVCMDEELLNYIVLCAISPTRYKRSPWDHCGILEHHCIKVLSNNQTIQYTEVVRSTTIPEMIYIQRKLAV